MRYILDLAPAKALEIQRLIEAGRYSDLHQFFLTAIENQLYVEVSGVGASDLEMSETSTTESQLKDEPIRALLQIPGMGLPTEREPGAGEVYTETLWALHNRIFPVKLTVRVLANKIRKQDQEGAYIELTHLADDVLNEAIFLGKMLLRYQKEHSRSVKLYIGLITRASPKSRERFLNSFIASTVHTTNANGQIVEVLDGAPGILRFVNWRRSRDDGIQLALSGPGLEFACLRNPILDEGDYSRSLSTEEATFFIQHLARSLPGEYDACLGLLRAISEGSDDPSALSKISEDEETVRASRISRLVELGFVERRRNGIRVKYFLTKGGVQLLEGAKSQQ